MIALGEKVAGPKKIVTKSQGDEQHDNGEATGGKSDWIRRRAIDRQLPNEWRQCTKHQVSMSTFQ